MTFAVNDKVYFLYHSDINCSIDDVYTVITSDFFSVTIKNKYGCSWEHPLGRTISYVPSSAESVFFKEYLEYLKALTKYNSQQISNLENQIETNTSLAIIDLNDRIKDIQTVKDWYCDKKIFYAIINNQIISRIAEEYEWLEFLKGQNRFWFELHRLSHVKVRVFASKTEVIKILVRILHNQKDILNFSLINIGETKNT